MFSIVKPLRTIGLLYKTTPLHHQVSVLQFKQQPVTVALSLLIKQQQQQQQPSARFFNTSCSVLAVPPPAPQESHKRAGLGLDKNGKPLPKMTAEEYRLLRDYYYAKKDKVQRKSALYYSLSLFLVFLAAAFASVPVYRLVCQKTGWGGTPQTDQSRITKDKLIPVQTDKKIRVSFTAETSRLLPWKFQPEQREVYVIPGESALAFYKAKNKSNKDITGMATYSVTPDHVAPYFNKIQCFCFEEQRLNAGEEIDMPLFFFIDPEFANDPSMRNIDDIVLHYTFFKATHDDQYEEIMSNSKVSVDKDNNLEKEEVGKNSA